MYCGEGTVVKRDKEGWKAVTLRCRSWGCPECAPRRRRELIALARSGLPNTFITLTSNASMPGEPYEKARKLAAAWRIIVRRAKAKYGYQKLDYLAVFEATKKGQPHLHILARVKWLDQRWLSDQMREISNAPIVDIRRVDAPGRAAGYIAKYVGKAPHHFGTCKRYWHTQGYEMGADRVPWVHRTWMSVGVRYDRSSLSLDEWEQFARARDLYFEREGERIQIFETGPPPIGDVPFE